MEIPATLVYALKRLALGVLLIAAASTILLLADREHRTAASRAGARKVQRVAILQHANNAVLDEGIRGLIDGLASRGFHDGDTLTIEQFNAQGDMPTGISIARQVTGGGYDLIVSSSTPSMQAIANNNRDGKTRHVFTLVADPFASGVGLDRANPLKHPPYMVGQGILPPVDTVFALARRMFAGLERIGVAWNPSETNSLIFVERGRKVAAGMGLTLVEANADNTSAVGDAVNALIARGAQAIWVGGDSTVIAGLDSLIAIAGRSGIPVFTILPGKPDRGTLFDAGPDFYQVGRQGGLLAADILEGADIAKIPVRDVLELVPAFLSINTTALKGLKEPWRVPDDELGSASVVVDETGVHKKATAGPTTTSHSADRRPLSKTWRVSLIELNRVAEVEDAEHGVLDGLKDAGLVEGRDYKRTIRNAQGDMATVSSLLDAASTDSDLLITFSTPTLQAAVQRVKWLPIVFNYLANPFVAGAGTNDRDHLPNVTGVYLMAAYDEMVRMIRAYLPKARVLGTVYVPAEVNMVYHKEMFEKEARANGFELKTVAANSTSEVADAALSLAAARVDAICQIPGNLTFAAFPNIAQVAKRARVPLFAFQSSQSGTAVLTLARDYYEGGRQAAALAARVMRGESPANIPSVSVTNLHVIVNQSAARAAGLTTPPAVVAKAHKVIDE
jgi:putative tryptophan/tyrosine transport system substrate-binding protein